MAVNATLRQEIHSVIDTIPEHNLSVLKPLLHFLVEDPLYIETDLTEEEHSLIEKGVKHYREHPEDFIPFKSLL